MSRQRLLTELYCEAAWLVKRTPRIADKLQARIHTVEPSEDGALPSSRIDSPQQENDEHNSAAAMMSAAPTPPSIQAMAETPADDLKSKRARPSSDRNILRCSIPSFPTALHLFGCTFNEKWASETEGAQACVISAEGLQPSVKPRWALVGAPRCEYSDDVDNFNPALHAYETSTGQNYLWLHGPQGSLDTTSTIASCVKDSPQLRRFRHLLGDGAPLSPVAQPLLSYHFHVRRNRRKNCGIHASLEPSKQFANPEAEAYYHAWDRSEPLTLPPLCSCVDSKATEVVEGHWRILRRLERRLLGQNNVPLSTRRETEEVPKSAETCIVEEPPPAPLPVNVGEPLSPPAASTPHPVSPSSVVDDEQRDPVADAAAFLNERRVCAQCLGLQYFPYSFIEIALIAEMAVLADLCERAPLPGNTDVFCEGPRVTACLVAKTPEHEWEIYKALSIVGLHRRAVIYDVCSSQFFPGCSVSEAHWSRTPSNCGALENLELETDTPLNAPKAFPLNMRFATPPSYCQRNLSVGFTAPPLRRIYCLTRRKLPEEVEIPEEDLKQIDLAHKSRLQLSSMQKLAKSAQDLRRQLVIKDKQLNQAKLEAAVLRLKVTSSSKPTISRRVSKLVVVNPGKSNQAQAGTVVSSPPPRSSAKNEPRRNYYAQSAAAARLQASRQQKWK